MKRQTGSAPRPTKRYLVVLAFAAAPLLWNLAQHRLDDEAVSDPVVAAGAASAAPDHALLMASDVERALPVAPRPLPEPLDRTTL